METYPVIVSCSIEYYITAEAPEQAEREAIELFLSDVIKNLDIEAEAMSPVIE